MVSYWETSKRVPRIEDVASYLTAIGVVGDDRERILELGRHAEDSDWLTVGIPGVSQQLSGTMACERSASMITYWSPNLIGGLLQTSGYARAIIGASDLPASEVEARVLVRMGRRDVVMRSNPVHLTALIGEATLQEPIGGPRVMAEQLSYLAKAAASETITVQVVRPGQGWHAGLSGPFVLYDFDSSPSIVELEHHRTGVFVYEAGDVAAYHAAAEEIRLLAMSPDDSLELITDIAHKMESEP